MNKRNMLFFFMLPLSNILCCQPFSLKQIENDTSHPIMVNLWMRCQIVDKYGRVNDTLRYVLGQEALDPGEMLSVEVIPCKSESGILTFVFLALFEGESDDETKFFKVEHNILKLSSDDLLEDLLFESSENSYSYSSTKSCSSSTDSSRSYDTEVDVVPFSNEEMTEVNQAFPTLNFREKFPDLRPIHFPEEVLDYWANKVYYTLYRENERSSYYIRYAKVAPESKIKVPGVYISLFSDDHWLDPECIIEDRPDCTTKCCSVRSCHTVFDVFYGDSMLGGRIVVSESRSCLCCCRKTFIFESEDRNRWNKASRAQCCKCCFRGLGICACVLWSYILCIR